MTLVLPRHVAIGAARDAARDAKDRAAATSIQGGAVTTRRFDSDDFVTHEDVQTQLQQLQDFIDARRSVEPGYHIPIPLGWRLSVLLLTVPETTSLGLFVASEQEREARAVASPQGVILALGSAAYQDPKRFGSYSVVKGNVTVSPPRPWCSAGDRITFVKYDAGLFRLGNGQLIGMLNDTQPTMVVDGGWSVPE